ncbi:Glycosyltransferase involved in cell wall bisynthesis [Marinitoga hydrogenitolerans DSM 16785]|uniref:Glycosyltransferase involved in cell wall bisynthesis n=1 Tax=Marinitoga hydrogenitolerans (strain DSM 16785 / JCM 12826 / AT1271) TaxID=1122195 RepID=A0A1M4Y4K9_MARH1|nr:glycosyltransferase family 1 protein [Marinitoga hydrogenitolerans]SHF00546.1 Glycosyltransferase involved in cell wall bisynthesis [Marinitoga hydrogenitolerans DSM 16785]
MRKKLVALDCRMYGMSGIGRYTENLLNQIINNDDIEDVEFVIIDYNNKLKNFSNKKNIKKIINLKLKPFSIKEFLYGHFYFNSIAKYTDLIHFLHINVPYFFPKRSVFTIHDLIPIIKHEYFPSHKVIIYKNLMNRIASKSKFIISVSNNTKKDLMRLFNVDSKKIRTIYEKISVNFPHKKNRFNVKNYFLYVGNRKKHKNLNLAIEIFDKIFDKYPNYYFIIVGKKDSKFDEIDKLLLKINHKKNFVQIIDADDGDLSNLYKNATALIFLSEYEGFGIPPLEAAYFGIPTIASNSSSIPEVVKKGGILVDIKDKEKIYLEIIKIIENPKLKDKLSKEALNNYNFFSNYPELEKIMDVYREILNRR